MTKTKPVKDPMEFANPTDMTPRESRSEFTSPPNNPMIGDDILENPSDRSARLKLDSDPVNETSEESFPASDPPAWNEGRSDVEFQKMGVQPKSDKPLSTS